MELTIVVITSVTLLTVATFLYIYWKHFSQQQKITDNRFRETITTLDNISKHLADLINKEFADITLQNENRNKLLINEASELKQVISSNIKELSTNYENQNMKAIESFKESHALTFRDIKEELMKILKEIKTPLDLD